MSANKINRFFVVSLVTFLTIVFSVSANASPRNPHSILKNNETEVKTSKKYRTQAEQVEAAYQELLKDMERKPAIQDATFTIITPKGRVAKTAFKPDTSNKGKADIANSTYTIITPKGRRVKTAFKPREGKSYKNKLRVTATAYTSHVNQTDSTPNIAAWGDRLKPGMKVIAVSRDLLNEYGLKHRQKVRIKGLEGEYVVLDKMNKRWRKKIDIYMGMNIRKAFRWGRRKVEIHWN